MDRRLLTASCSLVLCLALAVGAEPCAMRNLPGLPGSRTQLIDIDRDGRPELALLDPQGRIRLYRRGHDWQPLESVLDDAPAQLLLWGDLNGDALPDLVALGTPARCYLQTRRGPWLRHNIDDLGPARPMSGVLHDLDRDGHLDLAIAYAYVDEKQGYQAHPMQVLAGRGEGRFEDVTRPWGFEQEGPPGAAGAARPLYGLTACDLDNDGFAELLGAAYGRQWNTLWKRSPERARYFEQAAVAGIDGDEIRHGRYGPAVKRVQELPFRANGNTFALVPGDVDNDGDQDLFSAEITHAWTGESSDLSALLVNRFIEQGRLSFERCLEPLEQPDPQTGLRWRAGRGLQRDHRPQSVERWNQGDLQAYWADLNHDTHLDLLICESDYPHNRLRVFLQDAQGQFRESQDALGIDWPNCPGISLGDLDGDGDLDLVATGSRNRWPEARPAAALGEWLNPGTENRPSLWVRLRYRKGSNGLAIGSRVRLRSDGSQQWRWLGGPFGHAAQQLDPGCVHFGLGETRPLELEVTWPGGEVTTHRDLPNTGSLELEGP